MLARTEWYDDRFGDAFVGFADQLCFRRSEPCLVPPEVTQIQSEVGEDVRPVRPVNRPEAIKTNIGDSLNVVIQIERRPGRRFISEVLEINSYDPDADLFDFCAIYVAPREYS